jgi:hypothetical protein
MLREETVEPVSDEQNVIFGVNSSGEMFLTVISSEKGNDMNIPAPQLAGTLRSVVFSIRIRLRK